METTITGIMYLDMLQKFPIPQLDSKTDRHWMEILNFLNNVKNRY
jgi:hypothetical protein